MSAAVNFVLSERSIGARSALLALEGDTSPAAAERVEQRLDDIAARGVTLVIVDLSLVSFVDSSAVQVLAAAAAAARRRGARMLIVEPVDPDIARPLQLGRLDEVSEVVGTVDEAASRSSLPLESLRSAVPPPATALPAPVQRRRTLLGRRKQDQDILRELAQLRRIVLEVKRRQEEPPAPPAPSDSRELEAAPAHARIKALEAEIEATRSEVETLRADLDTTHAAEPEPVPREEGVTPRQTGDEQTVTALPEARKQVPVWSDPTPIDLNEAGIEDLMMLPGIGRRPAERILAFRDTRGGFRSVDDLFEITEIPRDRLARVRPYVRV